MTTTTSAPYRNLDIALLVLRIGAGIIFAFHGYQKVFEMGVPAVTGFFGPAGIPMAGRAAPVGSIVDLAGGIALFLGLFLRVVPWLLAVDMLGAIAFVHGKNGLSMEHQGYEFVLALCAMSVALALTGPGRSS